MQPLLRLLHLLHYQRDGCFSAGALDTSSPVEEESSAANPGDTLAMLLEKLISHWNSLKVSNSLLSCSFSKMRQLYGCKLKLFSSVDDFQNTETSEG